MSVVPSFLVRCDVAKIRDVSADVSEVWELKFRRLDSLDDVDVPKVSANEGWFVGSMEIGMYGHPAESELAKHLFAHPAVIELRWGTDYSDSHTERVTHDHPLIANNGLEFRPRSWMVDEVGRPLLDENGKILPGLDYRHRRMALLAQAFGAVDHWLTDKQWEAVDSWMEQARLGGMR